MMAVHEPVPLCIVLPRSVRRSICRSRCWQWRRVKATARKKCSMRPAATSVLMVCTPLAFPCSGIRTNESSIASRIVSTISCLSARMATAVSSKWSWAAPPNTSCATLLVQCSSHGDLSCERCLRPVRSPKQRVKRGRSMRYPLHIATDMIKWQVKNKLQGRKRYPVVLMLEPLYTCNLACVGCTPERHTGDLKDRLSLEQCLQAVDEAGAPVVSICGGEPTIYPELPELVAKTIARKRHVILCTNGILLERFFQKTKPHERLTLNVHLDGLRETHDFVCARDGVFDKAVEMIQLGKKLGYTVCTNTTIFRETSMDEIEEMFELLTTLG